MQCNTTVLVLVLVLVVKLSIINQGPEPRTRHFIYCGLRFRITIQPNFDSPDNNMAQGRGYRGVSASMQIPFILVVLLGFVALLLYLILVPEPNAGMIDGSSTGTVNINIPHGGHAHIYREKLHKVEEGLKSTVQRKREQLAKALESLSTSSNSNLPGRLKLLRSKNQIVGERLSDIKKGKETVEEILHAAGTGQNANPSTMIGDEPPMTLDQNAQCQSRSKEEAGGEEGRRPRG